MLRLMLLARELLRLVLGWLISHGEVVLIRHDSRVSWATELETGSGGQCFPGLRRNDLYALL